MKDFRENSHQEHLYLTIDASPKELVSSIYRPVHAGAAAEGMLPKPPPNESRNEIRIQGGAIRHLRVWKKM